jgi:hypothetical protein
MAKEVKLQQAPININKPTASFIKSDFDAVIFNQGYDVIIEKALRCPCKSKGADNLSNCQNCGSTGWVFINSIKTKAIIHSQNQTTKFKDWSEENLGNANVTVRDIDRLAFMDRITVLQGESIHTQTAYPNFYKNKLFSFLDYKPKEITEVFMFNKASEKLVLLQPDIDYTIDDMKIILSSTFGNIENLTLSLRYIHAPQYYVIDVRRDVMVSNASELGSKRTPTQMPISAMCRRAHYVLDKQNYNSDLIFDNSYIEDTCKIKQDTCN